VIPPPVLIRFCIVSRRHTNRYRKNEDKYPTSIIPSYKEERCYTKEYEDSPDSVGFEPQGMVKWNKSNRQQYKVQKIPGVI
jgi:hypothetical protein